MKPIKKILIIRFRQIGDSILAVALCSTLKKSFPDAEIHFVLNKNIASLYEGHPDIDKVITFDKNENKPFTAYIKKVWQVTHQNKYDVIIDMRSTIRTLFFSLFSLKTPFRIGRIKGYTRFLLNYRTDTYNNSLTTDMVERNLLLAAPLEKIRPIQYTKEFRLYLTDQEKKDFRYYMEKEGIDFARPVFLIGVTTKLLHKKWNTEFMITTLKRILEEYKDIQMIFNYAPGYEEEDARNIYKELGCPERIKIDIQKPLHYDNWQHFAPTARFISETKEEPDTLRKPSKFLHSLFIRQAPLNQCGYLQIPYLPEVLVPTIFFHRNSKQH